MSFDTNLQSFVTRAATEFKAHKILINNNAADLSALTTTDKTNLVAAINEVKAAGGGSSNLDGLSDVVISSPATGHVLRHNGTNFVNVLGTTHFQGASANLTALDISSTAYGRGFLGLANAAALMALLTTGTTGAAGILLLATTGESQTGTDTAKASTPAGVKAAIDQRIDNSALGTSTTNAPSANAVKTYADALLDANNAYQYKGVLDCSANPNYPAASAGHTYKISVAGKIGGASGIVVEVGDTATCLVDSTASGNQATVGANWIVTQTNVDGAVVGPASSTAGNFTTFSGTTGKVVQDSGLSLDTDTALTANSNTKIPSQAAVKGFAYSKTEIGSITTDYVALFNTGLV